ncbi:MAG TPA: hypothetical protein VMV79_07360, partial [Alphaproteobacteria bacterium]|nr:hypothetical protein [Alphaproteobacteria bacterium]
TPPPALGLPLIFSFFPFSFQFIHDTGPVRFALLIFPLGAMLLRRMTERKAGVRWVYAALLALLALLATEDKVFFLYLLPGYAFFCLAFTGEKSWPALFARLKKTWPAIMLAVVLATIGLAALFASAIDGRPYFDLLRIVAPRQAPATGFFYTLKLFIAYLLAWPAYAHRVFDMRGAMLTPSFFFFMVAAAGLFAGCVVLAVHKSPRRWLAPRPLLLALSFLATTAVFLILRNVWAGHHFIFLWPPLMVLFADLLEDAAPAARKALLGAFLALNALAVVILLWWPIDPTAARDRQAIFAYFHNDARAAQAIVNYSSWGGYYIQSLYGPRDQLVTYAQPLTPASARQLLALSRQTGRRLYDVCYNNLRDDPLQELPPLIDHRYYNSVCDQAYLEAMFGDKVRFEDLLPQQRIWHLFVAVPRD